MELAAGDVIFCHSKGLIGRAIRIAEFFRRDWNGQSERAGAKWNHVAILDANVGGGWTVIQAEARGVTQGAPLSSIAPGGQFAVLPLPQGIHPEDVLEFARKQVGSRYGFVTIACIALDILTPRWLSVRAPGSWICSAVGAESVRFGGWYHDWPDVYSVSPAELWLALERG